MFKNQECKTVLHVKAMGRFLTCLRMELNYRHHKLGLNPSLKFSVFFHQISSGFPLTK